MKKDTCSNRIKHALNFRNLKQIELAEKSGVKPSALNQYITGKIIPRQKALTALAQALDVNEVWLMGFDVPMERTHKLNLTLEQRKALIKEIEEKRIQQNLTKEEAADQNDLDFWVSENSPSKDIIKIANNWKIPILSRDFLSVKKHTNEFNDFMFWLEKEIETFNKEELDLLKNFIKSTINVIKK